MAEWKKILLEGLDLSGGDVTNNAFTVSDSEGTPNTSAITLGDTLTFAASGDLSVVESAGTITYSFTAGSVTNAFSTINAPNGTDPVAGSATATLNLTNGNGITITGTATSDTIDIAVPNGGIDTLQLAADAVTTAKITNANVTNDKLAADAVTNAKLADDAVQTENIVNSNVTLAKIANIAAATVLGNATASAAAPSELTIDADLSSVSSNDDTLASAKAIKSYVDGLTGSNITGFLVDDDNDETTGTLTAAGFVAPSLKVADASGNNQAGGLLSINAGAGTGAGAGGSIKFNVAQAGDAGSSVNSFSTAMSIDETGLVTINGGLDVNGTLTTIDTANLRVEDHLIQLNNTNSPNTTNANDGGIEVMTGDSTSDPQIFWSDNAHLAGWSIRKAGNATTAGRIMVQGSSAGDPTSAPIAGVGTMHYASTSKSMFVYVDS